MKIRAAAPALLFFAIFATLHGWSQTEHVKPEQIDAVFQPLVAEGTPGFAVGVYREGEIVFAHGYGLSDLALRVPIGPKTDFRLASLTKQFTATAIMLLAHDGKLSYDDPLTKLLPEFPAYGQKITIRQLLNHTSGLKDYEDIYENETADISPEKVAQLKDKDVLRIEESAGLNTVSTRLEMAVQQFGIRRAGHGCGTRLGQIIWRVFERTHLPAASYGWDSRL